VHYDTTGALLKLSLQWQK